MIFLNVGSNLCEFVPEFFKGWDQHRLDIDPNTEPDILCDARSLTDLEPNIYDGIYCRHNLEHYYHHEVSKVLKGFAHVLKSEGFVCIEVPDLSLLMKCVVNDGLDIDDILYHSDGIPISVRDVIYGWNPEIERSGNDFFAHKTGFTVQTLTKILKDNGFKTVYTRNGNFEAHAIAFINQPSDEMIKRVLEV